MTRVNLTLDQESYERLGRYAKRLGRPQATVAGQLVREGLELLDAREQRQRLAKDYAAGRADAREVIAELESGQLEAMGEEED
jgi:predicted DNA-binding protein